MGDCCNVKTLSYISASLQLAGHIIVIILCACSGAILSNNEFHTHGEEVSFIAGVGIVVAIIVGIIAAISIAFVVTLIVGIKQNRLTLVSIYVYANIVGLVFWGLFIIYGFVMGFVNKIGVGNNFLNLFLNLLYIGIFGLLFTPIYMLHMRMRNPSFQPENHGLRGNQPIHKPQYGV